MSIRRMVVTGIERRAVLNKIEELGIIPKSVCLSHNIDGCSVHLITFDCKDHEYIKVRNSRFDGKRVFPAGGKLMLT